MGTMDYPKMGPEYELARAYVPIQMYTQQYSPEDGLKRGTIFPELYRPYPPCPMMEEHCKD
ncbi:spore coat associated protein CotJA [Anoxybacter fermentans]